MIDRLTKLNLDRWGAAAGLLCAVHCVLTGLAIGLLSTVGLQFLGHSGLDYAFLAMAIGFGGLALVQGYRRHRSLVPCLFFVLGLASVALAVFWLKHAGHAHGHGHHHHSPLGTWLSVGGGALLVVYHLLNQRLGNRACTCPTCVPRAENTERTVVRA